MPRKAQELYRATYNRNWEKFAAGEAADTDSFAAEAHKAAWLAIKTEFHQDESGHWHHEPVGDEMKRRKDIGQPATGEGDPQS